MRATTAFAVLLGNAAPLAAQAAPAIGAAQYLAREQQSDGHWSAARGGGEADADLRVATWCLLGSIGDPSTPLGGFRSRQRRLALWWLNYQQDASGRFGLRADPDWLLDHAMATYAFAEAMRTANDAWLAVLVRPAAAALQHEVAIARPAVDDEVRLWCELVVRSLRATELHRQIMQLVAAPPPPGFSPLPRRGQVHDDVPELGAAALARTLARLPPPRANAGPRAAAARLLRETLAGRCGNADELPAGWPDDPLVDPLATFYLASAAYLTGGKAWQLAGKRLQQVLKAQVRDGDTAQTWDPVGEFGRRNGRLGTTAVAILLLQVYYRCSRLQLLQ